MEAQTAANEHCIVSDHITKCTEHAMTCNVQTCAHIHSNTLHLYIHVYLHTCMHTNTSHTCHTHTHMPHTHSHTHHMHTHATCHTHTHMPHTHSLSLTRTPHAHTHHSSRQMPLQTTKQLTCSLSKYTGSQNGREQPNTLQQLSK